MSVLQTFNHPLFGELPLIQIDDKPFFGATAAAKMLGYSNTSDAITRHTKLDGVVFHEVIDSLGRKQNAKFISEGNLYRLITNSKLPNGEQFESWVFDEVLPSIRKHGAYMTTQTIDNIINDPEFGIQLLTTLKKEREEKEKALRTIEIQRPKVVYADAVEVSEDTVLVKDLATVLRQKGVNIGEVRLFRWLRENRYLCKQKGEMWNMPTQRSLDLGIIVVKHGLRTGNNGEMKKTRTPKITGKGQIYFINKILAEHGLLVI